MINDAKRDIFKFDKNTWQTSEYHSFVFRLC